MFSYRLFTPEGDNLGEATYPVMIHPGEKIVAGENQRFHVLDLVPVDEEEDSRVVGLLEVEAD